MPKRETESYTIKSVAKALDMLESFCDEGDEFSLAQICTKLELTKTNAFRLMATFEHRGYLERLPVSGSYRVGIKALETSQKFLSQIDLPGKAASVMEKLAEECGEDVYIAIPKLSEVIIIDRVASNKAVQVASQLGKRFPYDRLAMGKVIHAHSGATNVSGDHWAQIRAHGFCIDQDVLEKGISSAAVPIFNRHGDVAGSLGLLGPSYRFTEENMESTLLPKLIEAGRTISSKMGHFEDDTRDEFITRRKAFGSLHPTRGIHKNSIPLKGVLNSAGLDFALLGTNQNG